MPVATNPHVNTCRPVRAMQVIARGAVVAFETPYTDAEAYQGLSDLVRDGYRSDFARDLVRKPLNRLSPKQVAWVHKLLIDARTPAAAPVAGFKRIVELFDQARGAIAFPAIAFPEYLGYMTPTLILRPAGSTSAQPGAVNLFVQRDHMAKEFVGRINRDGFLSGRRVDAQTTDFLTRLANDPAATAATFGIRTGRCVFCRQCLSDARSLAVGYGPICARNYALPWGDTTAWDNLVGDPTPNLDGATDGLGYDPEAGKLDDDWE
jgi:hypothetical protein